MAEATSARDRRSRSCISRKHGALLHALCHADADQRVALLRTADRALVRCICECALNVLNGVVALKPSQKKRLSKHKHVLRKLVSTRGRGAFGWQGRKRTLVQSGGAFLPMLLAPIVGTLISKLFDGGGRG